MNKKKFSVDVAVLIIFFNRDKQLRQVFDVVKKARPSKLYLYQDGARKNKNDIEGIMKCRKIVDDTEIDWDCTVKRFYQEKNFGCDPSEYIAQKWLFENEIKGIVLEDDDVPAVSFFKYCKELLDYYENDDRINIICGMNNMEISNHINESYLFTKKGSIWGWASWRRVIKQWDGNYSWLDDPKKIKTIETNMGKKEFKKWLPVVKTHKESGKEHYESILAATLYLNNSLNIVPKYNMISNIGIDNETTHSVSDIRLLPKKIQNLLHMKTYEINLPLTHPQKIEEDLKFKKEMTFSKFDEIKMKVESIVRTIKYQGVNALVFRIKRKFK